MSAESNTGAVVLCGGKSSRMGKPKHLLPFGNQVVLQRVVQTLAEVTQQIVVVAGKDQELPTLPATCEIVRDEEEFQGPLYGLLAGLNAFANRTESIYLTGCDVPLLKPEVVRFLIDQLGDAEIAVTCEEGFFHPLAAVYRTRLAKTVAELLATGERRPRNLFQQVQTRKVSVAELREVDPQLDSLCNMNTPEEYAELLKKVGLRESVTER